MKKIADYLIVITLIVAFQSCQKDEAHINEVEPSERLPEQQEAQPDISTTLASLSEINGLQQKVSASDVRKKVSWSTAKNEDKNEIWLDRERIIKTVDSVGNATYAVRFMVPDAPYNEFYNLIVADRVHGQPIAPFVQAYTIDPDYYVTYTKGDRTENGFQGTVSVYSLNAFLGDNDLSFAKLHVKNPCYKNLVFNGRGNGGVGGQARDDRQNANGHNNQGFSSVTTTSSGKITTTISNSYLQNATKLSIARTMIHESVHAYLLDKNASLDFDFRKAIQDYGKRNGFDINKDPNRFHHEFMAQYVNAMAYSLLDWDTKFGSGGKLGWQYYHAMAFGGLFYQDTNGNLIETDSFKKLVPNDGDRNKIKDILKNEQDGNSTAKGNKC